MLGQATSGAVVDEPAQAGREPVGIDQVDEMAISRPFLELHVREHVEPRALPVGDRAVRKRPGTERPSS